MKQLQSLVFWPKFLFAICVIASLSTTKAPAITIKRHVDSNARYLVLIGRIEFSDDALELQSAISDHRPDFVTFDSPGGNVIRAIELGRTIRRNRLKTLQIRQLRCESACALVFMGGVQRVADPGAIGVHRNSFSSNRSLSSEDAVETTQRVTALVIDYLNEMGVSPSLLSLAYRYSSTDIRYLSNSEMQKFGVVTASPQNTVVEQEVVTEAPRQHSDQMAGLARHPRGSVFLQEEPTAKSARLGSFKNGSRVEILGVNDRWYQVKIGNKRGFLHATSIKMNHFFDGGFQNKHIQIKSFPLRAEAVDFAKAGGGSLSAFQVSNGWYAITISGVYRDKAAKEILTKLKSEQRIPEDSFVTFGNTYVRKICCN